MNVSRRSALQSLLGITTLAVLGRTRLAQAADPSIQATVDGDPKHVLVVPWSDVEAGVEKNYDIKGQSRHNHVVTLTAEHFEKLKSHEAIEVESTNNLFHSHLCHVSVSES